ncbi:rhodanese-like domain-containing protein [Rhizobium rhizogenes]|uniref:rhodanese-like domain-containing protein n=1 Tax=Rhizobium rhizogenes TaxID=359 RepID=UPI001571D846|nr:rhodanese-like domain-containing protein [Rhizobium rhizogenes]NTI78667.1 thiosulfate sulfurtransferase [Rhizobium rhizogenes]
MSLAEATIATPDRDRSIAPHDLRREALDGREIAVVDIREGDAYAEGHISIAVELPLSELEIRAWALLPRHSLRIVVTDDNGGEAALTAARRLEVIGYSNVRILEGGLEAWQAAGFELITGEHSLSKALGEFVEREYHTPKISAQDLQAKIASGEDLVILDTRPIPEYNYAAIPGGIAAPGAELLYRVYDQVKSPDTPVVINCAGRTRAIIGAQALKNAGFPNPVYSLENGTSAWILAGFEPARGANDYAGLPSPDGLAKAGEAAARIAERFAIRTIDKAGLERFRTEGEERTLYLHDIRTPEEFAAAHLPGSRSVPGGQLVQNTDRFVGSLKGRVVLIDGEDLVRSRITASWLVQLGLENVFVYAANSGELTEKGPASVKILGAPANVKALSPNEVRLLIDNGKTVVVDLEPARPYWEERRSIPGSRVARRSTLSRTIRLLSEAETVVLTSADGTLAGFAAAELAGQGGRKVVVLEGGTKAWIAAGYDAPADGPGQQPLDADEALPKLPMLEERRTRLDAYVHWGDVITDHLKKDGLVSFRSFGA